MAGDLEGKVQDPEFDENRERSELAYPES